MNLFRRQANHTTNEDSTPAPSTTSGTPQPATPPTTPSDSKTAEELARQWWREHTGEPMPEEATRWLKQLTRAEARRQQTASQLLTPQQQTRIEDARRLAETKLRNIENSLLRIRDGQEWIHRFNEKKHELAEHQSRLYEVNKQMATMAKEEEALERFETFETVQGLFQRMTLLQALTRANKEEQSLLAREAEQVVQHATEEGKLLNQATDQRKEAVRQMMNVRDQLEEANRIIGAQGILDLDRHATRRLLDSSEQQQFVLEKECEELQAEADTLSATLARLRAERQTMEPHSALMEHGEMVLALLERLGEMQKRAEELTSEGNTLQQRGREENDMLSRVFADFQRVEAEIKSFNTELGQHRAQNLGQSSYALQERAMSLKGRRQMLISALSLWKRISSGYQLIEEKNQTINRLRLELDNLQKNLADLEEKVIPMRQLCHEKEYTLTLSKSQNVIQLRGDLKEGVSCTVCGATHHPYHSDTMLEQSQLISELRTDHELLAAELLAKEQQLREMQLEHARLTAQREAEEENLSRLRTRQMEDVREWEVFSSLDRTFSECSPDSNLDARTAMLRQLIENTALDADNAQKELDEFNFHQTRINEINEQLTKKEQQKADLTLRLNEVNTGCQVLARQTEQNRQAQGGQQERFTQLYERLTQLITLGDWYAEWQQSHESLQLRISNMMEQWQSLCQAIQDNERQLERTTALLDEKRQTGKFLTAFIQQIRDEEENRQSLRAENDKRQETITGGKDVKEYFEQGYRQLTAARTTEEEHRKKAHEADHDLARIDGRQAELVSATQRMDADITECQQKLDVWMRQFNASHPPVQYNELESAFALDRDWNAVRTAVRALRIESMLEQARVDSLRSAIVALQAEGIRPSDTDTSQAMAAFVSQQKQLERQRSQVLMQLAQHELALQNHEACKAQLKAEEEELYVSSVPGQGPR